MTSRYYGNEWNDYFILDTAWAFAELCSHSCLLPSGDDRRGAECYESEGSKSAGEAGELKEHKRLGRSIVGQHRDVWWSDSNSIRWNGFK